MNKAVLKFHQKFTEKQISRAQEPKMAVSNFHVYYNGQFVF